MHRAAVALTASVLLVGPAVLAFFAGGYFDGPRLVATLVAWGLVLVAVLSSPEILPRRWPGRAALLGLALITVWTAVSLAWAPLAGPATDNLVRNLLYLGALLAAIPILRDRRAARAVEPMLALGAFAAVGYGLSGRLLPGRIDLLASVKGGGRLEQPITYWNAEGLLAAMGLVLCIRLAGDITRPLAVRAAAAAGSVVLGLGLYLTYSRGAIAAAVIGLVVLLAAVGSRPQLRALGLALAGCAIVVAGAVLLPGVASVEGTLAQRKEDGWVMLAVVAVTVLAAAALCAWISAAERRERWSTGTFRGARRLPALAGVTLALGLAGLIGSGLAERSEPSEGRGAVRLTSVDSRRYDYWRVATDAIAEDPLRGAGSGAFRVIWLRERPVAEGVLEVHSLPLEMAVELGLPGLLGLGLLVIGTAVAAGRSLRSRPALAAGPAAAGTVWLVHATIDWDWQLPAVTLFALVLGGALIAASEAAPAPSRRRAVSVPVPGRRRESAGAAA
jgi:hypothetical protein